MQRKSIICLGVLAISLVILGVILLVIPDAQIDENKSVQQSSEISIESVESSTDSAEFEGIYKNGVFVFTAAQVKDQFGETLPEGFLFVDEPAANLSQNGKLQWEIMDVTGMSADISLLLNVTEEKQLCNQIALVTKSEAYKDDAEALLDWYLVTFAPNFEESERAEIVEEYLDMFDGENQDYRVYSSGNQDIMINYASDESGKYYYVMLSVQ